VRKLTPILAIRKKCLDCSAGSFKEVRLCPVKDCPLWTFRFGIRPETAKNKGYTIDPSISEDNEDLVGS
jgi:hypothetical protein